MSGWRRIVRAFDIRRWSLSRHAAEEELQEELDRHLEEAEEELVAAGLSREDARLEARRRFGDSARWRSRAAGELVARRRSEAVRNVIDGLAQDLRIASRVSFRTPMVTCLAILALSLGIGGTTALFSTIRSTLSQATPYPDAGQLVVGVKTVHGAPAGSVSAVDYYDYRDVNQSFTGLAALSNFTLSHASSGGKEPEALDMSWVTWNLFAVLGVRPVEGRLFTQEDEEGGRSRIALISYDLWQSRFGSQPDAIGRTVDLDGESYTVVGVLPRGFRFLFDVDVWTYMDRTGPLDTTRGDHSLLVVGRLKPGVGLGLAQEEADQVFERLARGYPDTNAGKGMRLTELKEYLFADVHLSILLLEVTTAVVLIIACANVAGLLLARGDRRRRELTMRLALGASRRRLIAQLLTESLGLAVLAGVLGVGLAVLLNGLLGNLLSTGGVPPIHARLSLTLLIFATAITVLTGLLAGIAPALRASSIGRGAEAGAAGPDSVGLDRTWLRGGLVVIQVALSVVLLVGSALLTRSLSNLTDVDLGFDPDNLLTAQLQIPWTEYRTDAERAQFFEEVLDRVGAIPGVTSAGLSTKLPIVSGGQDWLTWPAELPEPPLEDAFSPNVRWVSPRYFETLGIELLAGRDISRRDEPGKQPVAVLSETSARRLFGNRSPLGRHIHVGGPEDEYEVIGVVKDARLNALRQAPDAAVYMSAAQRGDIRLQLAVRMSPGRVGLAEAVKAVVYEIDPKVPLTDVSDMERVLDSHLSGFRTVTSVLALFAVVAVTLAAIGLFGTLAFQVNQRRREVGVRLAMGASRAAVLKMVLSRGMKLVASGMVLGMAVAYPAVLLARRLLFNTSPLDLASYLGVAILLTLVAVIACLVPAWRALHIDVVEVLKAD